MLVFGIDIPLTDIFLILSIMIAIIVIEVIALVILLSRQLQKAKRLHQRVLIRR